jgi:hypothetical protein
VRGTCQRVPRRQSNDAEDDFSVDASNLTGSVSTLQFQSSDEFSELQSRHAMFELRASTTALSHRRLHHPQIPFDVETEHEQDSRPFSFRAPREI